MKHDKMKTTVLSVKMIPNADPMLREALNLREDERSLGLLTTDCDDVSYAALDEATKKAEVRVAYARSMYAGAANASTKLAGEFIGILAGRNRRKCGVVWMRLFCILNRTPAFTVPMRMILSSILPTVFPEQEVIYPRRPAFRREQPWLI